MSEIKLPPSGLAEEILQEYERQEQELQVVTFTLTEQYAVPIHQVQEIIRVGKITRVPNAPEFMEGVINLRGRILPVVNLRKRLKLPDRPITKSSRIMVVEIADRTVGVLVDSVNHVMKLSSDSIESPPEEVLDTEGDYIKGVGKLKNSIVIILDMEKLFKRDTTELYRHEGNSQIEPPKKHEG